MEIATKRLRRIGGNCQSELVTRWLLAIVSVPILGIACSSAFQSPPAAEGSKSSPNDGSPAAPLTVPELAQQRASVSQLYDENCSKCHGDRGQGGGGGTQSFNTLEKYDQKFDKPYFDAIKNGVPDMGMEPYGQTLSDEQIWGLVVHIRELQHRALREGGMRPKQSGGVFQGQRHNYKVETVIEQGKGLRTPWGIDWLPDGLMLITSRSGAVHLAKGDMLTEIQGVPASRELGQGGMMEVAVHPDYAKNGWIYLSFSDPAASARGAMTKVVRGKLKFNGESVTWSDQQTIFELPQSTYTTAGVHFGSRIVFDKGKIYFSIGERGNQNLAQDLGAPNGKIFRLNDDGTVPSDNPFAKEDSPITKAIWSFGHRNPQGLVKDLEGNIWDTEHGPRGGDELNLIKKGANYGWPVVAFSINYNDAPFRTPWPKTGQNISMPAFRWLPSIGACGLDVVRGTAFPQWKGDLMAGGLSGANVDRIRVKDGKLVEREEILFGMGRVREVATGPDGFIYVALNQPDKVIRVVPAK
jgi:glucose/arabinose dehydrogenase